MDSVVTNSAQKFFNTELIKNLSNIESKCQKKGREAIVKSYEKKYDNKKDMPFEVGKAILNAVNEHNDMNQLTDLNGQILKNAKYLVEERINKLAEFRKD